MSATEVVEMTSVRVEHPKEKLFIGNDQQISYRKGRDADEAQEQLLKDLVMYSLEANPENFPDGGREAYLVLIGAFFGLIADFGIPNSMGAIEAYISQNQLAHLNPSTTSWIFTLHMGTMYFGGVFAGGLFDRYGSRKLLIVGAALMFVGLIATAELKELYQFIISFGIVTALGLSLATAPLIGVLSHWFLRKRAMACSTATIGGLIGSSVFVIMLKNLYKLVKYKWAIRILAFLCLFCMSVAIALVKEKKQTSPRGGVSSSESLSVSATVDAAPVHANSELQQSSRRIEEDARGFVKDSISYFAPLKDIRFVSLVIAVLLAEVSTMTILTYLASFALAGGISELKSYLLLTIVNVSGIPARLITGLLADKLGRFNVMLATSFMSMVFVWGLLMPATGNLPFLYAFSVLFGVLSSAVLSLIAACLGQICPALQFGNYFGVLYFCLAFLTVLGFFCTSLVINTGSVHEYQMWIVFEGCVATACVFAWVWARWCNVGFRLCKF